MRHDTALLIGSDNQWRQARGTPLVLKRRDFGFQRVRTRFPEIVFGDVDTGDQALLGQNGHFGKRRVADDEMLSKAVRLSKLRLQDIPLAQLE